LVSGGVPLTTVTSSKTFSVPCSSSVTVEGLVVEEASFFGQVAMSWSGACTGDALDSFCTLRPTLPSLSTVVLECGCAALDFGFASTCGGAFPSPSPVAFRR
jgi:hypothetical protein